MQKIERNGKEIRFKDGDYSYYANINYDLVMRKDALMNKKGPEEVYVTVSDGLNLMQEEDLFYVINKVCKYAHTVNIVCKSVVPGYIKNVYDKYKDKYILKTTVMHDISDESFEKLSNVTKKVRVLLSGNYSTKTVERFSSKFSMVEYYVELGEDNYVTTLSLADQISLLGKSFTSKVLVGCTKDKTNMVSLKKLRRVYKYFTKHNIDITFDRCVSAEFINSIMNIDSREEAASHATPCDACLFSIHVNTEGYCTPCVYSDKFKIKITGVDSNSVWKAKPVKQFRKVLLNKYRTCFVYNLNSKKW